MTARVAINLCTFRRPRMVETLRAINALRVPDGVDLHVLLIDNDASPSARAAAWEATDWMRVPLCYIHAPAGNIALARNAGLDASDDDWIAFLDDDETVPPDWLVALLARQEETDADAVFGHSKALYNHEAPHWIVARDYHSNIAAPRGGIVETGYTCNALLRWGNAPWRDERFDVARGRSGGEDTEFFFRLHRMGARFAIADEAVAYEEVPPERLSFSWLQKRRYRMGQSYASSAIGYAARSHLFANAAGKTAFCYAAALVSATNTERRNFWLLRGALHRGVCAGCLSLPSAELYGN